MTATTPPPPTELPANSPASPLLDAAKRMRQRQEPAAGGVIYRTWQATIALVIASSVFLIGFGALVAIDDLANDTNDFFDGLMVGLGIMAAFGGVVAGSVGAGLLTLAARRRDIAAWISVGLGSLVSLWSLSVFGLEAELPIAVPVLWSALSLGMLAEHRHLTAR